MSAIDTGVAIMGREKIVRTKPRPGKVRANTSAATVPRMVGPATPRNVKTNVRGTASRKRWCRNSWR